MMPRAAARCTVPSAGTWQREHVPPAIGRGGVGAEHLCGSTAPCASVESWRRRPKNGTRVTGTDIRTVQGTWPIGKPLVDSLGDGLREVRSTHEKVEYRVLFIVEKGTMVLLPWLQEGLSENEEGGLGGRA